MTGKEPKAGRNSEAPSHAAPIAPPPLIFALCALLGVLLDFIFPAQIPAIGEKTRIVAGLFLASLSGLLALWARIHMKRARTAINPYRASTSMVKSGPFLHTRNPMYVSLIILTIAAGLLYGSPWLFASAAGLFAVLHKWVVLREEAYLYAVFGKDYTGYTHKVRRWM